MENKINIAELLRDCPKGMELNCTMFDNVTFEEVVTEIDCDGNKDISIVLLTHYNDGMVDEIILTEYGTYTYDETAKCVIFPKGKTTWKGFHRPFIDGDILATNDGKFIAIIKKNGGKYYCCCHTNGTYFETDYSGWFDRFATEEEKQILFDAIRTNGYCWNAETKILKNLFPYDIGTKVWVKSDKERKYIHTIVGISRNSFGNLEYEVEEEKTGTVVHYPESLLIPIETKEPKFKVGDKIKSKSSDIVNPIEIATVTPRIYTFTNGSFQHVEIIDKDYELISRKFDITTLKPFDKVLVRDDNSHVWKCNLYSHYSECHFHYVCVDTGYKQCIPFEGNEHLLGTNNDCDDFYRNW